MIELLHAVRSHLWVDQLDIAAESETFSKGTRSLIEVAIVLQEQVLTPHVPLSSSSSQQKQTESLKSSVFRAVVALRGALYKCVAIEPYLQLFFNRFISNLEIELMLIQLEHMSAKYFRLSALSGRAGELIIMNKTSDYLSVLHHFIESASLVVSQSLFIRQSIQATAILLKILDSHHNGDLNMLCKHVDLLICLSKHVVQPMERYDVLLASNANGVPHASSSGNCWLNDLELLKLDVSHYTMLFDERADSKQLPPLTQMSGKDNSLAPLTMTTIQVDYVSTAEPELQLLFSTITGLHWSEALHLRREVAEYLPLLHKHAVYQSCVSQFMLSVIDSSASGIPGEISTASIRIDRLEALIDRLNKYSFDDVQWGKASIVQSAAQSILNVRRAQLSGDLLSAERAVKEALQVEKSEIAYNSTMTSDCSWLGGEEGGGRGCEDIYASIRVEVQLASLDVGQRMKIELMQSALSTSGIPNSNYPFDLSHISTQHLIDALLSTSNSMELICQQAKDLHHTCTVMIVLRQFALDNNWVEMKAYLGSLDAATVAILKRSDEYHAAIHVSNVSFATELAVKSYLTGRLGGIVGNVSTFNGDISVGGLTLISSEALHEALSVFELIEDANRNRDITEHINACRYLSSIRFHVCREEWLDVFQLAKNALYKNSGRSSYSMDDNDGQIILTIPLSPLCLAEIQLACDHACYMVSLHALLDAIRSNGIYGTCGNIKLVGLDISNIQKAYEKVINLNCNHPYIQKIMRGVEVLFKLRKAIMLDRWIDIDHTKDYLAYLNLNFFNPSGSSGGVRLSGNLEYERIHMRKTDHDNGDGEGHSSAVAVTSLEGLDSVESILQAYNWKLLKRNNELAIEVEAEINLIQSEMLYRRIVSVLIHSIHSPGILYHHHHHPHHCHPHYPPHHHPHHPCHHQPHLHPHHPCHHQPHPHHHHPYHHHPYHYHDPHHYHYHHAIDCCYATYCRR